MKELTGNIIDLHKRRIYYGRVQFAEGKIISITEEEGRSERYILPGFVDAHVHVESSMLIPSEFAR
ncbi:MAG: adenine deaminase, partial [Bacteroidetes bacterium]